MRRTFAAAREHRLIIDAVIFGFVGAAAARVFQFLLSLAERLFLVKLAGYVPPGLTQEGGALSEVIGPHGYWLVPVATTLGGLITGFLVYNLASAAEGEGIDDTVRSFHRLGGFIRTRVPFVKTVASAITIGSGGSAGREGPAALIAAGFASIYARGGRRSEADTRMLVLIGMAAGLSAIFRSPIGTAFFAIEVLYSEMDFESSALVYTTVSAVVAYAVNGFFVGFEPLFRFPERMMPREPGDYVWYGVLGLASGTLAAVVPVVFYGIRDAFRALPMPVQMKPALGGLLVGVTALALPQVLAGGYGWMQQAINGRLPAALMLLLALAKLVTFAFTVGSGGSGGGFAPALYIGAMLGGFLGKAFEQPVAGFALVGMASVFAGAARVPIAAMLMVIELTGGYHMLVPAALAVVLSYLVQVTLSRPFPYRSLYGQQVQSRAYSPAHRAEHLRIAVDLLNQPGIALRSPVGRLELVSLLASGVPVSLPDGRRMGIGVLRPTSRYLGRNITSRCLSEEDRDVDVLRVWRSGVAIWPVADASLEDGDRILMIASEQAWKRLGQDLDPFPSGIS